QENKDKKASIAFKDWYVANRGFYNQIKIAEYLGVAQNSVSYYLSGERIPTDSKVKQKLYELTEGEVDFRDEEDKVSEEEDTKNELQKQQGINKLKESLLKELEKTQELNERIKSLQKATML
ncbi:MAG: hypothetical protein LBQ34_07295, partial [Alphaproteobacteria bacterium]|nr:hypothetical protein [Alphaproteobacteria bacterium]